MKLVRYSRDGAPRIGVVAGDGVITLDRLETGFSEVRQIAAAGQDQRDRLADLARRATPDVALSAIELLAPIERPGKYLGIGMNYGKHAEEAAKLGVAASKQQVWFNKQTTCITGPYAAIDPGVTEKLDYEAELGVVIGAPAKGVTAAEFGATCSAILSLMTSQRAIGSSTHKPSPWENPSTPTARSARGSLPPTKFRTRTR